MADIPVNENDAVVTVIATSDGQTDFDFDFLTYTAASIFAVWTDASGVETELNFPSDFTVSGVGNPNGGSISWSASTVVTGDQVVIYRSISIERLNDYQNSGDFRAETVNTELDQQIMIMQELRRDISRSLRGPIGGALLLALAAPVAGQALVGNPTGNGFVNGPSTDQIAGAQQFALDAEASALRAEQVAAWFSNRTAEAATTAAALPDNSVVSMGGYFYRTDPSATGSASCTNDLGVNGLVPMQMGSPEHFGASGRYTGAGVTPDDTAPINAALSWAAAADGRHLNFGGWYFYEGTTDVDFGRRHNSLITCAGQITFGTLNAKNWTLHSMESGQVFLNIRNGGLLGDFTNSVAVGGTTAVTVHSMRGCKISIQAQNYLGRILHTTSGGSDQSLRCIKMRIEIQNGNRAVSGDDANCGQALFADSGVGITQNAQTGGYGTVHLRGEGMVHGSVFQRLKDIHIERWEDGFFVTSAPEMRGCGAVTGELLYLGETYAAAGADAPGIRFVNDPDGLQCTDISFDRVSMIQTNNGIYCENFAVNNPGLAIDRLSCREGDYCIAAHNMTTIDVGHVTAVNMTGVLNATGTNQRIAMNVAMTSGITGTPIVKTGAVLDFRLTGTLNNCGGAGFSLIDLGTENDLILLNDLILDHDTADQLVNIGFAGANKVRMTGGSVSGASAVFTSGRRPEYVANVNGYQTVSQGTATITNAGNKYIDIAHGLANQVDALKVTVDTRGAGRGFEFTCQPASATTTRVELETLPASDVVFTWWADNTTLSGDIDA